MAELEHLTGVRDLLTPLPNVKSLANCRMFVTATFRPFGKGSPHDYELCC